MDPNNDGSALFKEINLDADFPDLDDVEGYIEQADYYDHTKKERTYFYRVGSALSTTFIPCADVDCEGVYYIRDLIALAYKTGKKHLEGTLPCCVCKDQGRKGECSKARFSIDIKYKLPEQEPEEGPTIPSPDDRLDLY